MDPLSHPEPSVIADEVALLSSGFANNVNVSELAGDHDDQQTPRLEASNSSPIEASPHSRRAVPPVAPATSSPSNALTALAPSGVTSSVQFAIPSQPLVSLETLATPRTSSEDGTPRAPTGVAAHVEDDGPRIDSNLDALQRLSGSLNMYRDASRESLETARARIPESESAVGLRQSSDILEQFLVRHGIGVDNDPSDRAETLIKCMEVVPDGLVLRYEALRSADSEGVDGCAICHHALVDSEGAPDSDPDSDVTMDASPASPSVVFPCAGKHLFHAHCLLPWLAQNTTCPSCRFDIDPARRLWVRPVSEWQPPQAESMRDWLAGEEEAREAGVRRVRPEVVMPEYPRTPSPPRRAPQGSDFDPNFERDFAAWFNPDSVNANSL